MARRQVAAAPEELGRAAEVGRRLAVWFTPHGRQFPWRTWRDPYRLVVVEILLQRTKADVVAAFAPSFFASFPDWPTLANAREDTIVDALTPIGLQQRRAATLSRLAKVVTYVEDPVWSGLPGIGQYVERAVAVAISGAALAMVDANFVRIIRRVFADGWMADYRYDRRLQGLAHAMVQDASDARSVNWAVLDLGATVCTTRAPHCPDCPLLSLCDYGAVSIAKVPGTKASLQTLDQGPPGS